MACSHTSRYNVLSTRKAYVLSSNPPFSPSKQPFPHTNCKVVQPISLSTMMGCNSFHRKMHKHDKSSMRSTISDGSPGQNTTQIPKTVVRCLCVVGNSRRL